jgi:hypothetical protein
MPLETYWNEYALPHAETAIQKFGILPGTVSQETGMHALFHEIRSPTPLQSFVETCDIPATPQLFIIEEATGSGKTEAVLVLAHRLMHTLIGWRRFIGPFEKNDMAALYTGIAALKSGRSKRGREFMKNTITDHMIILKQFYLLLIENEYVAIPEKKLKALKTPHHETMTKVASDLLTTEEITAMVGACTRSSDRAIIMMLYEGGFRIGEIGGMKGETGPSTNGA